MAAVGTQKQQKAQGGGKSGLRRLKPGEVLFNDGDHAESLYIIQKGQLRLYKPKGKGFIEIAVLRAGEVIGEMAYFDEDGSGNRRSCAAKAMVGTEIIEISFVAFKKTMAGLNPWFKTIINTLAKRLRKANSRIRELESNSVSHNYGGGGASTYEFFRGVDIVKSLSVLFLVMKGHGESGEKGLSLHKNTMSFYAQDVFNVQEVKFDQMMTILTEGGYMSMEKDENDQLKVICVPDIERIRSFLIFFNSQRTAPDEKKIKVSERCQTLLEKIVEQFKAKGIRDSKAVCDLSEILDEFKARNVNIGMGDLEDARKIGYVGEVVVGSGNKLTMPVEYAKLTQMLPTIKIMNSIAKFNETQSGGRG
jgi:CRP-like cAMP-binding protein